MSKAEQNKTELTPKEMKTVCSEVIKKSDKVTKGLSMSKVQIERAAKLINTFNGQTSKELHEVVQGLNIVINALDATQVECLWEAFGNYQKPEVTEGVKVVLAAIQDKGLEFFNLDYCLSEYLDIQREGGVLMSVSFREHFIEALVETIREEVNKESSHIDWKGEADKQRVLEQFIKSNPFADKYLGYIADKHLSSFEIIGKFEEQLK